MRYGLAVFDLDGILLGLDNEFLPETAWALKELYDSDVKLMICSGRAPSRAKAYFLEAGVWGCIACANGAYIENEDGEPIRSHPIEAEPVECVARELRNTDARNASDCAKEAVDHVTGRNDGHGVAVAIRQYVLSKKQGESYENQMDRYVLFRDRDQPG